jgi:hypothetical protein
MSELFDAELVVEALKSIGAVEASVVAEHFTASE